MAKVRRYYYVGSESSRGLVHRSETRIEGGRTFCTKIIPLGWRWWLGKRHMPAGRKFCEKCR